jgi:hypothetical protein
MLGCAVSGCGGEGSSQGSCLSIADGSTLQTQALATPTVLTVQVYGDSSSPFKWKSAFVSSLFNVTSGMVELPGNGEPVGIQNPVRLTLYLPQGNTTGEAAGQFTFEALVANPKGSTCTVQRVFGFNIAGGQATVF